MVLRVLCLHGARQDGEYFRGKLLPLIQFCSDIAEFTFPSGSFVLPKEHDEDEVAMRSWFSVETDVSGEIDKDSWEMAMSVVDRTVAVNPPGFDVVLGFSQGNFVLLRLLLLPQYKSTLKAVILCGAPIVSPSDQLIGVFGGGDVVTDVPSLHIIGSADTIVTPSDSVELASAFRDASVWHHPHGHCVPHSAKDLAAMRAFLVTLMPPVDLSTRISQIEEEIEMLRFIVNGLVVAKKESPKGPEFTVAVPLQPDDDAAFFIVLDTCYPFSPPRKFYFESLPPALRDSRWPLNCVTKCIQATIDLAGMPMLVGLYSLVKDSFDVMAENGFMQVSFNDESCHCIGARDVNPWECESEENRKEWARRAHDDAAKIHAERKGAASSDVAASGLHQVSSGSKGEWHYVIGLVGKPSAGKSTFFNAITNPQSEMEAAKIGAFPFTTIEPNVGKAFFGIPCPCSMVSPSPLHCGALHGHYENGLRRVAVTVKDVAGLVPGAYRGRGKGNQFLNDLCDADVLIHVVDASGKTTVDGVELCGEDGDTSRTTCESALDDIQWVREEIHSWIYDNVKLRWNTIVKKPLKFLTMFTGYHSKIDTVVCALERCGVQQGEIASKIPLWQPFDLHLFIANFLLLRFPMLVALNKSDCSLALTESDVASKFPLESAVSMSAKIECTLLTLRRRGIVEYTSGSTSFTVTTPSTGILSKEDGIAVAEAKEYLSTHKTTGTARALGNAVALRAAVYVFPVSDLKSLVAHRGDSSLSFAASSTSVLRHCLLLHQGSCVEDLYNALCAKKMTEGKFVRCEALNLGSSAFQEQRRAQRAEHEDRKVDLRAPQGRHCILRKDDPLQNFCVVKVMTNRMAKRA